MGLRYSGTEKAVKRLPCLALACDDPIRSFRFFENRHTALKQAIGI